MFTSAYRLPSRIHLTPGKTFTSPLLRLKVIANNLDHNRFGFVVSKKVDKRAVIRNRSKRVVRSVFEDLSEALQTSYDILCLVQKPIAQRTPEIEKEIKDLLTKASLL